MPVGVGKAEFEANFPLRIGEDDRYQRSSSGDYTFRDSSQADDGRMNLTVFEDKFELSGFTAKMESDKVTEIRLMLNPEKAGQPILPELLSSISGVLAARPADRKGRMQDSDVTFDIHLWDMTGFSVRVMPMGAEVLVLVASSSSSVSFAVAKDRPKLEADLDVLLNGAQLWTWDAKLFELHYTPKTGENQTKPPQFEWLTAAKDRARFSRKMFSDVETKLTMFGGSVKVEEATLEFVGGKVARATISFYNRGDSGEIAPKVFSELYRKVGQNLGQVFKVNPRSQIVPSNAAIKIVGWSWATPTGTALLEYNELIGQTKPEFLRLKLAAPNQADWSMGRLAVGVQRMALTKNIIKKQGGDIYIAGVPMVDQGAKGYCVAASCQRLFEYMHIPCDQHEMAQLLNVDVERGANAFEMQKSLARVDGQFRVAFKPLVNPEMYFDNKGKRRVSMKEFAGIVKEHADKGVPLLWALQLGLFKEDPPLPGEGQVSGGHMRMIIGYNSTTNKILFTDSWGAGHELKRMDATDAYEATLGLYSMSPRGL